MEIDSGSTNARGWRFAAKPEFYEFLEKEFPRQATAWADIETGENRRQDLQIDRQRLEAERTATTRARNERDSLEAELNERIVQLQGELAATVSRFVTVTVISAEFVPPKPSGMV